MGIYYYWECKRACSIMFNLSIRLKSSHVTSRVLGNKKGYYTHVRWLRTINMKQKQLEVRYNQLWGCRRNRPTKKVKATSNHSHITNLCHILCLNYKWYNATGSGDRMRLRHDAEGHQVLHCLLLAVSHKLAPDMCTYSPHWNTSTQFPWKQVQQGYYPPW